MQIAEENMPDCPNYEELRAECLAWHNRAALLERQLLDKEVEIVLLKEQNRMLVIGNVRLIIMAETIS